MAVLCYSASWQCAWLPSQPSLAAAAAAATAAGNTLHRMARRSNNGMELTERGLAVSNIQASKFKPDDNLPTDIPSGPKRGEARRGEAKRGEAK
jgi:hypothetical protein